MGTWLICSTKFRGCPCSRCVGERVYICELQGTNDSAAPCFCSSLLPGIQSNRSVPNTRGCGAESQSLHGTHSVLSDIKHAHKPLLRSVVQVSGLLIHCHADDFSETLVVNHKDGNGANNVVENLEWVSQQKSTEHAVEEGLCPGVKKALLADVISIQNTSHGRSLLVVTAPTLSALQGTNQLTDSPSVAEGTTKTHTSMQLHATLCIERALHVTLPSSGTASESAASVTAPVTEGNQGLLAVAFEWTGVAYATPAVALSHAASASWHHQVALPMAEAKPGSGGELELAPLHLQVRKSRQQSERSHVQACAAVLWFVADMLVHRMEDPSVCMY